MLIPALTGYIDKAKEKDIIAETRSAVMATQTLVDEAYAGADIGADTVKIDSGNVTVENIKKLAEIEGTINETDVKITNGKVTGLVYEKNGKKCTYSVTGNKGTYTVSK